MAKYGPYSEVLNIEVTENSKCQDSRMHTFSKRSLDRLPGRDDANLSCNDWMNIE